MITTQFQPPGSQPCIISRKNGRLGRAIHITSVVGFRLFWSSTNATAGCKKWRNPRIFGGLRHSTQPVIGKSILQIHYFFEYSGRTYPLFFEKAQITFFLGIENRPRVKLLSNEKSNSEDRWWGKLNLSHGTSSFYLLASTQLPWIFHPLTTLRVPLHYIWTSQNDDLRLGRRSPGQIRKLIITLLATSLSPLLFSLLPFADIALRSRVTSNQIEPPLALTSVY